MLTARRMTSEDLEFAVRLTDTMHWNLAEADFEFAMELEPEGCLVLLEDSERIGLVTNVCYGRIGWLGNLIVDSARREKGAGSLLVKHSLNYFASRNVVSVGLYAYEDRIPFYRRLGFHADSNSEFTVLQGESMPSPDHPSVRRAATEDLNNIVSLDQSCFGASRAKLLEPIVTDDDNLCYVREEDRRIQGCAIAKVYGKAAEIGPVICPSTRVDVANELLEPTLDKLRGFRVSLSAPRKEDGLLKKLVDFGLKEKFTVTRMFYGPPSISKCIYFPESLERG